MKHKLLSLLICFAIAVTAVTSLSVTVGAEQEGNAYETYTYWEGIRESTRKAVYSRPMFNVDTVITANSLGLRSFKQLNDVFAADNGYVYLLDSDSRIIILNGEYAVIREIGALNSPDGQIDYSGAKSITVTAEGVIYICDTENARVLLADNEGNYLGKYVLPDSPLIPEEYEFRPMHAVLDSRDYLYVLSDGSYYGMILYNNTGDFLGFYGANEVTTGVIGVVKNVWNRMFVSNTKKSNSARKLPYVFSDIVTDSNGFVYASTGYTDRANRTGQIKKFSLGTGQNILESADVNFTDDEINTTHNDGENFNQNIIGMDVDENGFIYCLDSAFGRIFLYDKECTMLTSFGTGMGEGTLNGTFVTPSAISAKNNRVYVTDSSKNTLTVFKETNFAKLFKKAQALTLEGEYIAAKDAWLEIITLDRNIQPAYKGLARVYLTEGDYSLSMEYAENGYDRKTYALAYEMRRREWLDKNFGFVFAGVIIVAAAVIFIAVSFKKKNRKLIKNRELKLLFSVIFHPARTFADIQEKGLGKIGICVGMLAVYYVTTILKTLKGGFLFTYYDAESFNSLLVLIRSAGIVVLWIVCNWMICTLTGGKGKIRDISVITCYSLMALIIENILQIILTNMLLPTESEFLGILHTVALLYTFIVLSIGMIKIHDFSFGQFVGTGVLTVIGMAAVVFLGIMIILLVQQLYGFIASVVMEMFL